MSKFKSDEWLRENGFYSTVDFQKCVIISSGDNSIMALTEEDILMMGRAVYNLKFKMIFHKENKFYDCQLAISKDKSIKYRLYMTKPTSKEVAEKVLDFVNSFGFDAEGFAEEISNSHRTLQQSTMTLFLNVVKKWAGMYDNGWYDDRNKSTVKISKAIMVMNDDKVRLPRV